MNTISLVLLASFAALSTALSTACSAGPSESTASESQTVTHSDGFGHTWTDSTPTGTYTDAEAFAACTAFAPGTCAVIASCNGTSTGIVTTFGPTPPNDVWGWIYAGPNAGGAVHVTSSCVQGTANACQVASRAEALCLNAGVTLPASEVQPPMTIVGRWQ